MKRKFLRALPHLTAALAVCVIVITYIDNRNPMMGFLRSNVGYIYLFALGFLSLFTAIRLIVSDRAEPDKPDKE